MLTRNQKLFLYSRGGRTLQDVIWIFGQPKIEMLSEGKYKLYDVLDEKIEFENDTKRLLSFVEDVHVDHFANSLKSYIIETLQ